MDDHCGFYSSSHFGHFQMFLLFTVASVLATQHQLTFSSHPEWPAALSGVCVWLCACDNVTGNGLTLDALMRYW